MVGTARPPTGCFELDGLDPALGEVLAGHRSGRSPDEEIAVSKAVVAELVRL